MQNDTLHLDELSFEQIKQLVLTLQADKESLHETLLKAVKKIDALSNQVAALQKLLFGKKSERYIGEQTPLLPGFELPEAVEEKEADRVNVKAFSRGKSKGHQEAGWNPFPDNLPREEIILDLPKSEKEGLKLIGYESSERLCRRSEFIVKVIKRAKYAVSEENFSSIVTAEPLPNVLSENSDRAHYDHSVAVHCIYDKFINHLPFYRQSEDLKRIGINISRGLMCDWAMKISFLLKPLYFRLAEFVMASEVIHADETPVRMFAKGKCKHCYIWVRRTGIGPPLTVFYFSLDRKQKTAQQLMGDYLGTFISDNYAAYNLLPGERAACWAHARRAFFDVPLLGDPCRLEALSLIRQIYMNERLAQNSAAEKKSDTALVKARKAFRKQSEALVENYFQLCEKITLNSLPPSSPLMKAANYSLKQKEELSVFLKNPKVSIDNNPAENTIRPWALGRKNWLFVGNEDGGEMAAIINSLAMTCRENKVDFEAWMNDVLPKLSEVKSKDIDTLLPHLWKPAETQE